VLSTDASRAGTAQTAAYSESGEQAMRTDDPQTVPGKDAGEISRRFVTALAAKDAAGLTGLLGAEIDFAGLTPGRTWEARTAGEVAGIVLGTWFGPEDVIERVESVTTGEVAGRHSLGYRLRVSNPDGRFLVEQRAFLDVDGGRITWMRVLCSGYRPDPDSANP